MDKECIRDRERELRKYETVALLVQTLGLSGPGYLIMWEVKKIQFEPDFLLAHLLMDESVL